MFEKLNFSWTTIKTLNQNLLILSHLSESFDVPAGCSTTFHNISRITTVYSYNITYPYLEISLELQRKPSFYVIILIIPSILIASLSASGLLLPSEAGEKVSVQMTALLSYMLLFLLVVDILPPVGGNFPIIGEWTE